MTTASSCEQVTSFAITSRSRRALAAGVSSDFVNAKTSSFWKVTVASHRLGTGAGAGGGTGKDRGAGAGAGCGAGSGAVAQDASRTALPTARVSLFTRLSFLRNAQRRVVFRPCYRRGSYTTSASGSAAVRAGKIAGSEAQSGWFERS